jgi:hypothetical protein
MGDLSADKNKISEEKSRQSIFNSSKFWGLGPRHKESLSEDIEIRPAELKKDDSQEQLPEMAKKEVLQEQLPEISKKDDSQEQIPENTRKPSTPNSVKLYDTTNGKFIFTRGWDGTNMSVYQIRRKNL